MSKPRFELLLAALFAILTLVLSLGASAHAADADSALADRVDVLAEEIARLREQMSIPETDAGLHSAYGMGPAASKVYGVRGGVALGGYGEFLFTDRIDGDNVADFYRFITYLGYKFDDRIVMNAEIEFEHATTSENAAGKAGEVSVEFAYLDFLLDPRFNIRAGNMLVPVGIVNEMHEPPFYRGNSRPAIERTIIPTTWRELGVGAHGQINEQTRYTALLLNGLNASEFSGKGVRGGRQKANRALWNDVAGVLAVEYDTPRLSAGVSGFYGGADQGQIQDGGQDVDVANWVTEAHTVLRGSGAELRGLVAVSGIDKAEELSAALGETIPDQQFGWYLEGAWNIAPFLFDHPGQLRVEPWVRYEQYNLQGSVPTGLTADPAANISSWTAGVQVLPHPQVALKLEFERVSADTAADEDSVRAGAGFIF